MADEDVDHVVRQDVLTHLLVPFPHMVEGFTIGEIKDKQATYRVAVI